MSQDLNGEARLQVLQEVVALLQQGRQADAVPLLEKIVAMYPEQLQHLPELCNEKSRILSMLAHFTFMTRKDPLTPPQSSAVLNRGDAHCKVGKGRRVSGDRRAIFCLSRKHLREAGPIFFGGGGIQGSPDAGQSWVLRVDI